MNAGSAQKVILTSFFGSVAVVTYREVIKAKRIPIPFEYGYTCLTYGILAVAGGMGGDSGGQLAAVVASGLFVGILMNLWPTTGMNAHTTSLANKVSVVATNSGGFPPLSGVGASAVTNTSNTTGTGTQNTGSQTLNA